MPAFAVYGLNSLIEKNTTVPTITVSGCDSSLFVPWCTLRWQNHSSLGWSASELYGRLWARAHQLKIYASITASQSLEQTHALDVTPVTVCMSWHRVDATLLSPS